MKLTRASSYALQAVAYMAMQKTLSQPIASHTIAQARQIPERFLLKVLKPLVSARILISVKGPNGGYRLARNADEIALLEIVEAVDGTVRGSVPIDEHDNGSIALKKKLDVLCQQAADKVRDHLSETSIADLVRR